ncbi:MAG: nucleoside-diphosphate sugar epimerase/dehydratase [Gudongella sp.]|nr:nucleoside-diphosphate sugar epimerase/dehydratase [Gudongella sp.]
MRNIINKMRVVFIYLADIIMINLAYYIALWLRFDGDIDPQYFEAYGKFFLQLTLIKLVVFTYFKIYKNLYKYASVSEVINISFTVLVANALSITFLTFMQSPLPRSVYIIVVMLDIFFIGGSRLAARVALKKQLGHIFFSRDIKRILIIGAGDAGAMVIREYKNHVDLGSKPVAIIDDDISKKGTSINRVPIVGQRKDIIQTVKRCNIDEIVIAIPSASKRDIKEIVDECKNTKAKIRIVPGIYELIDGTVTIKSIRDIDIKDVLGRDEVKLNMDLISQYIENKIVLVTGGGGSIGSELARQIVKFNPKKLILLDIYENGVFEIQNEIIDKFPYIEIEVKIASVRDKQEILEIMEEIKPDIVFHAAAHKHVPLMESNPKAAFKNNVLGAINLVEAASKVGVKRFVMISTDKAVNPTNVMGATKRLCEMIVQSFDKTSKTEFVAVRFGNVLESSGSVVPTFKRQVKEGGPLTVTHPEITRYFMTIPEASQLVLEAGSMARGGEIFILDMGQPVKILNLAEDIIRLSGYEPYKDIDIVFTGLRPGEKLYEELLLNEEGISETVHNKIHIAKPFEIDYTLLKSEIEDVESRLGIINADEIKDKLKKLVPTYKREQ